MGSRVHHLESVDVMRVLTIAGVVAVHVVTGTNPPTSVPAGAATILLHVNREIFVLITALVLTYSYLPRQTWSLAAFWRRRYWLVATPYVAWTVVYFLADGPPTGLEAAVRQLAFDIATGGARYHLYFLLVSMQLYLVFPLLLVLVRATRGHHAPVLAVSAAAQLAFTAAIHLGLRPGGPLGWWLAHPDSLLPSYQLYALAGAVLAVHVDQLATWVRRHRRLVVLVVLAGIAAGLGSYLYDVAIRLLGPLAASEVFQPAVTLESLAAVLGLYALGVWWADRPRPGWLARAVAAASDASFGIFLAHPLVLQGLLTVAGATGLLAAILALPGRYDLAAGLLAGLPLVLAITWIVVWVARRGPLSLPLTGRSAPAAAPGRLVWAAAGLRTLALGLAIAAAVSWLDLSSGRVPGMASAGSIAGAPPPLSAALPAAGAPSPPPGAEATVENIRAGLPAVVVLHGFSASIGLEETRDGLLPLAASGRAILVYPVGYQQSWNAGACCGAARLQNVDDVAFLEAVAERVAADPGVDPGRISLVGYSNGGKMAYRLACAHPAPFSSVAVVLALPVSPCSSGPPVSLLQVAVLDDGEIPYAPGDPPFESDGVWLTPVTREVAAWRSRDGCTDASSARSSGRLRIELWAQCERGLRVELASYSSGGHYWPAGDAGTPAAGQVVWDFVGGAA